MMFLELTFLSCFNKCNLLIYFWYPKYQNVCRLVDVSLVEYFFFLLKMKHYLCFESLSKINSFPQEIFFKTSFSIIEKYDAAVIKKMIQQFHEEIREKSFF